MSDLHRFIHRKIVVLPPSATLQQAARAMCDNWVGCVLVSGPDGDGVGGIVTDRDLACRWLTEGGFGAVADAQATVDQLMTPHPIMASEDTSLNQVIQLMESHGVRRIPIVSGGIGQSRKFVGIVTLDDLLEAQVVPLPRISRILKAQFRHKLETLGALRERARPARAINRSEAHHRQTLRRFYSYVGEATGLTQDLLPEVSYFVLGALATRVTASMATHFVAQLPELLRDPLLSLPLGPDRAVTAERLVAELVETFGFTEAYSRDLLHRFIAALDSWMSPGQLSHLRAQLPTDFQPFFESVIVTPLPDAREPQAIGLTSPAFAEGGDIPRQHTGEGADRSPPLSWSGVPQGTRQFALICEDPDAHRERPWTHWVVFGISPAITSLPEGLPATAELEVPLRLRQGTATSGKVGYQGPLPPRKDDWHRYVFTLYALDREIPLRPGGSADELRQQMKGHILGEGRLVGRYRSRQHKAA